MLRQARLSPRQGPRHSSAPGLKSQWKRWMLTWGDEPPHLSPPAHQLRASLRPWGEKPCLLRWTLWQLPPPVTPTSKGLPPPLEAFALHDFLSCTGCRDTGGTWYSTCALMPCLGAHLLAWPTRRALSAHPFDLHDRGHVTLCLTILACPPFALGQRPQHSRTGCSRNLSSATFAGDSLRAHPDPYLIKRCCPYAASAHCYRANSHVANFALHLLAQGQRSHLLWTGCLRSLSMAVLACDSIREHSGPLTIERCYSYAALEFATLHLLAQGQRSHLLWTGCLRSLSMAVLACDLIREHSGPLTIERCYSYAALDFACHRTWLCAPGPGTTKASAATTWAPFQLPPAADLAHGVAAPIQARLSNSNTATGFVGTSPCVERPYVPHKGFWCDGVCPGSGWWAPRCGANAVVPHLAVRCSSERSQARRCTLWHRRPPRPPCECWW
jgi:hypothetical protein